MTTSISSGTSSALLVRYAALVGVRANPDPDSTLTLTLTTLTLTPTLTLASNPNQVRAALLGAAPWCAAAAHSNGGTGPV